MRLRYRIPLALISILMVMTLFLASSYALWRISVFQETENLIETGCFSIVFDDTDSSSINLNNTYPMVDESGLKTVPYTFTIKNTCTVDADYTLFLNTLEVNDKIPDSLIRYSLIQEAGALNVGKTLESADVNTDKSHFKFDKKILNSYVIESGSLKGRSSTESDDGEEITYHLRLWIDQAGTKEGTNNVAGKTFEAGVSVIAHTKNVKLNTGDSGGGQ